MDWQAALVASVGCSVPGGKVAWPFMSTVGSGRVGSPCVRAQTTSSCQICAGVSDCAGAGSPQATRAAMLTMRRANVGRWVRFIASRAYGRLRLGRITRGGDFATTKSRDAESPAWGTASARPPPMITARMGRVRSYWRNRFGLRARMAASYVLVTAAAVIVVEVIAIAFAIPSLLANQDL